MAEFDPFWGPFDADVGWVPSLRYLLRRARILSLVKALPRGRLMEVGCGSGALLLELARLGFSCTAIETSPAARAVARALAARHGVPGPAILPEASPEWIGGFDVVAAFDVLEHIADDRGALGQWVQWLRPGGRLLVSVPAHSRRWNAGDEWAGHHRRYERRQLEALLMESGLIVEHVECYGFPFANLSEAMGVPYYRWALRRRESADPGHASSLSGVDRKPWLRVRRLVQTRAGKAVIKAALVLQNCFLQTDWGSGYLIVGRLPCKT